jgi:hypothetical protein
MRKFFKYVYWCLILSAFFLYPQHCYAQIPENPISKELCLNDPRLDSKITIKREKIFLGEFLEEISKQSGIAFIVSDKDRMAGLPLTVSIKDQSVANCLNALWSFVSYSSAICRWEAIKSNHIISYKFIRSNNSMYLNERLLAEEKKEFGNHIDKLLDTSRNTQGNFDSSLDKSSLEGGFLSRAIGRTKEGINLLADNLSNGDLKDLISKNKSLEIPFGNLDPKSKKFVTDIYGKSNGKIVNRDTGAELSSIPFPKTIKIRANTPENNPGDPVSCIFIEIGDLGGYGYIGGNTFNKYFAHKISEGWILLQDSPHSANEKKEMKPGYFKKNASVFEKITNIAEANNIPLICAIPESNNVFISNPKQISLADYLDKMEDSPVKFIHKWNGNFLLLSYSYWFYNDIETRRVHWEMLKMLRMNKDKFIGVNDNLIIPPLELMAEIGNACSLSEMNAMVKEVGFLESVISWQDFMRNLARHGNAVSEIQTINGISIIGYKKDLGGIVSRKSNRQLSDKIVFMRVRNKDIDGRISGKNESVPVKCKILELLDKDRKIISFLPIYMIPPAFNR